MNFQIKNGKSENVNFVKSIISTVIPGDLRAYTIPGEYTFTVPDGVTKVRVVCIGGGSYNDGFDLSDVNIGGTSSFGSYINAKTNTTLSGLNTGNSNEIGYIIGFNKKIVRSRTLDNISIGKKLYGGSRATGYSGITFKIAEYNIDDVNVTPGENIKCIVGKAGKHRSANDSSQGGLVLIGWNSALNFVDIEDIQFDMPREIHVGDYVDIRSSKIIPENANANINNFCISLSNIFNSGEEYSGNIEAILEGNNTIGFKATKVGKKKLGIGFQYSVGFYQHDFHKYYEINILP